MSRVLASRCRLGQTHIVNAILSELACRCHEWVFLQLSHSWVPSCLQFCPLGREVLLRYHPSWVGNTLPGGYSYELAIANRFNLLSSNMVKVRSRLHLCEYSSSISFICILSILRDRIVWIFSNELFDLNVLAMVDISVSCSWKVVPCCPVLKLALPILTIGGSDLGSFWNACVVSASRYSIMSQNSRRAKFLLSQRMIHGLSELRNRLEVILSVKRCLACIFHYLHYWEI